MTSTGWKILEEQPGDKYGKYCNESIVMSLAMYFDFNCIANFPVGPL